VTGPKRERCRRQKRRWEKGKKKPEQHNKWPAKNMFTANAQLKTKRAGHQDQRRTRRLMWDLTQAEKRRGRDCKGALRLGWGGGTFDINLVQRKESAKGGNAVAAFRSRFIRSCKWVLRLNQTVDTKTLEGERVHQKKRGEERHKQKKNVRNLRPLRAGGTYFYFHIRAGSQPVGRGTALRATCGAEGKGKTGGGLKRKENSS